MPSRLSAHNRAVENNSMDVNGLKIVRKTAFRTVLRQSCAPFWEKFADSGMSKKMICNSGRAQEFADLRFVSFNKRLLAHL
jgi:hypothetical protein